MYVQVLVQRFSPDFDGASSIQIFLSIVIHLSTCKNYNLLTVRSLVRPERAVDLLDVDVERKRALVRVVVAELAVQDHLAVVVAD